MIISNIEIIPGKRILKHLGMVQGNTVRAKHVGKDLLAGLKNIVGGELKAYTELLNEAREEATVRMVEQAKAIGANAVVLQDVPDGTTAVVVPAKIVDKRESQDDDDRD